MKYFASILITGFIMLLSLSSCKNTPVKEYYIISTGDSTDFSKKYSDENKIRIPRIGAVVPGGEFYYDLVIIFDSTDFVYLYQTDYLENKASIIKTPRGCVIREDDDYYKFTKHPIFLGLSTEHLLKFDSKIFIDFIKSNNDIFRFDTSTQRPRIIFLASNKDTIMNSAFYDVMTLTKPVRKTINRVHYIIRMTTEEENNVIFCKRRNIAYNPHNIKWSKNFLNGAYYPLTKEYDSIVNFVIPYNFKARSLLRMDSIKFK